MSAHAADRPRGGGMISLLSSERRKLTSIRAPWIVLGAFLAAAAGILALDLGEGPNTFDPVGAEHAMPIFTSLLPGLVLAYSLGMLAVSADHRHGTYVPTYLVTPRRGRVLVAKLLTAVAAGTLAALLSAVVVTAIGLPWLAGDGVDLGPVLRDPVFWGRLLASAVAAAVMAVFGAAVAALLRSVLAAVVVFVGLFALEMTLATQVPSGTYDWMVFHSLIALLSLDSFDAPPFWPGSLVVLGWAAVVAVAAAVRTVRGDVR